MKGCKVVKYFVELRLHLQVPTATSCSQYVVQWVSIRASVPPYECSDCGDIDIWNVVKNVANPNV
jgi:hypothetical protein